MGLNLSIQPHFGVDGKAIFFVTFKIGASHNAHGHNLTPTELGSREPSIERSL